MEPSRNYFTSTATPHKLQQTVAEIETNAKTTQENITSQSAELVRQSQAFIEIVRHEMTLAPGRRGSLRTAQTVINSTLQHVLTHHISQWSEATARLQTSRQPGQWLMRGLKERADKFEARLHWLERGVKHLQDVDAGAPDWVPKAMVSVYKRTWFAWYRLRGYR